MTGAQALERGAAEQAALVRGGELGARELVEAALARIDERDGEIGAIVARCDERALAEADAIAPGDPRPLCGVPVALKDLLGATEGLPTTNGSHAFGDWVADHDSAHIRRLRAAGAIVVGKTAAPELGMRPVTESARYGVTRNPWDPRLAAGGSSGGSAAAVAAGMVALADGSDLGGSIRIPASCCGVVGLKPSRGRVSIGPDFSDVGLGTAIDGPLARSVYDAALALDVMSGYEPGDHHWLAPPPAPFVEAVRRPREGVGVRVALEAPLGVPVDAEPRAAARKAAAALADLGHRVVEQAPDWDDEDFAADWSLLATGALQHIVAVVQRLHGRPLDPNLLEPATREWVVESPPVGLVELLEAHERLGAFSRRVLASWPADAVLLTPTLTRLPALAGAVAARAGVTDDAVRFSAFVRIWNVTGQPAISLPVHETADGVPVGIQLIAAAGREDLLLSVAAQLEEAVGWRPRHSSQYATRSGRKTTPRPRSSTLPLRG
jgi:amidase